LSLIRPIGHEQRLSIVEHLDELRSRIIICIAALVVAFGVCWWQNHQILDWLNKPLVNANRVDCEDKTKADNALERSGCFDRAVGAYLRTAAPALAEAAAALDRLAREDGVSDAARAEAQQASRALRDSARAAQRAAELTPKAASGRGQPVTLGVAEPFLTTITVSAYAGLLLALPVILFQAYAFILPAFTREERRVALPVMAMVPVLFLGGVAFAYFLALPRAVDFLQNYNDGQYDILVQARDYYRFVVMLLGAMGLMFQLPVGVLGVVRLQLLSPEQLRRSRGYALVAFAVVAAIVTPTPDPFTMLIAMAPLALLYEISIQLARLVAPKGPSRWSFALDDDEDDEPHSDPGRDDDLD